MISPGSNLRLEVTGIAPGGVGVADQGRVRYYVRGGLPGDVVDARVVSQERGRTEAVVARRVRSRIARIAPRCRHFEVCGGCLWQDIDYSDQLALKKEIVQHSFREAGIDGSLVADVIGSVETFFHRNKMDFTFGRTAEGAPALGLYVGRDSRGEGEYSPVFDVEECLLQSPLSNDIVRAARDFLNGRGVQPYDPVRRTGLVRSLVVREGKRTGEVLVDLVTASPEADFAGEMGEALAGMSADVKGVVLSVNPKRSKNALPASERTVRGAGRITERVAGLMFHISPGSFFQVNTAQADRLYGVAVQLCRLTGTERVLDLYCGTGTLSLIAARGAASVTGVEAMPQAAEDARRNAALNGIENCRFLCGDVLKVLPDLTRVGERFEVVTVNPPRAGIYRAVIQAVCGLQPNRIVYISCNPETLARDIPRFWAGGYRLETAQPVDMFPHTPHCEVVAGMARTI